MISVEKLQQRKEFYNDHLTQVILKYWMQRIDEDKGGFFTCYNVEGNELISTDKYTWSQGRCTWMYAKLAASKSIQLTEQTRSRCRELANMGAEFLQKHCILPDGGCAFCVDGENNPIEVMPGKGFAISSFADCFVIIGFSACAILEKDASLVMKALELFNRVQDQVKSNTFATAPNILPEGWRSHAIPMIMLNTGYELSMALEELGFIEEAHRIDEVCQSHMKDITTNFMDNGIVHECLNQDNSLLETLYGRHTNPGHTNECMWFLIEAAQKFNHKDVIQKAADTVLNTSRRAWDQEYGGMMYYLDRDGGIPKGKEFEEEEPLARGAVRDWSNKLWWVHTETIYSNLLCYFITNKKEFLDEYEKYHQYTFSTFPNLDTQVGEWIQIRNQKGEPVVGPVGGRLPVKDPYHITRNLMLLIELLEEYNVPWSKTYG